MLTTILAQGSSVFDRRTLLSAFLPAVVFWGLTAVVVLDVAVGWRAALHSWQAVGGVAQGLALAAFLVWSALWAFLTAAMSTRSIRFLEGYGPRRGATAAVRARLRNRHVAAVDALERADTGLEMRQVALLEAGRLLVPPSPAEGGDGPPGSDGEMHRLLSRAELAVADLRDEAGLRDEDVRDLPGRLRAWWSWSAAQPAAPGAGGAQQERQRRLDSVLRAFADRVARAERAVEAERAELLALLAVYPADRSLIMPTRLGNVVRAAEGYGAERYGVDTVLVWPRLHPLLPDVAVKAETDARTVLDLLLNVCLSVVLFGLPLSAVLAFGGAHPLPWWTPLLPLLAAVAVRCAPAVLLSAAGFAVRAPGLPESWSDGRAGVGLQLALTGFAVVALLSTATYRAAVESAAAWGEQLKSVVDLYRWHLLDKLNVRRPADPEQERLIWGEVTGVLHRGYPPDAALVGHAGAGQASAAGSSEPRLFLVPVRPLPAFHPVGSADVQPRWVWQDLPDEWCAAAAEDIVGRSPLQALEPGRPVPARLLLGPDGPGATGPLTEVGIGVTEPDALGGTLRPGDRVDLTLFSADHGTASEFPGVLVLRYVPGPAAAPPDPTPPNTLVVAVDPILAAGLMRAARNATAVATRPLPLTGPAVTARSTGGAAT
ncbi:hypothetical protein ACIA98_17115 [Streptomyces sp. NPDC051366]|uniref:hypothetical protein n=1 Tax=Streptomyces sp. NPDC051366 TaxID=3365652 RepID=UPI00379D8DEE